MLGHPTGNSLPYLQTRLRQNLSRRPHRDGEIELILFLIHHQQRPGVRAEVFRHFFHDGLQDRIKVERGCQRLGDIVKDG